MTTSSQQHDVAEPAALKTALELLEMGYWPVPIYGPDMTVTNPGKRPIGVDWGRSRHTPETLRAVWVAYPKAGVGMKLGKEGRVIDVEIDDRETGEDSLTTLMGGENFATKGWTSRRGGHLLFAFDDRLARYGKSLIKHDKLPGLEIRIGEVPGDPKQMQSVCPPSPMTEEDENGRVISLGPREWNGIEMVATLPASFFTHLDVLMATTPKPAPEDGQAGPASYRFDEGRQRYALAALDNEIKAVLEAAEGNRNIQLNTSAFSIGQLVGSGAITLAVAWSALESAARSIGLGDKETLATLRSGFTAGQGKPRDLSGVGKISRTHDIGTRGGFVSNGGFAAASRVTEKNEIEWDDPVFPVAVPATPFPFDVFPEPLIRLLGEGSVSVQCPIDYFATAALAMAGGVVGMTVNLAVTSTWVEAPNLYAAIVGPPGTKKTPAVKIMARPLFTIDRDLREEYVLAKQEYEAAAELHEAAARRKEPGRGEKPTEPVAGQLTMDDVTREAMAQVHAENLRGLVMVMDELTSWVASLNAYKGGKGDDKQFWLKVNSGSLVKVNRKGNREPILIPRPCVSIVGGLTPGMLPLMRDGNDDGWLDRILFSYPDPSAVKREWTDSEISDEALDGWNTAIRRLWSRKMVLDEGRQRPYIVHLTAEGKRAWVKWYNGHAADVEALGYAKKSLAGPWSKLEGFCLRIALILTQIDQAYSAQHAFAPRDVDASAIERAGRVIQYFKDHFRRTKGELTKKSVDMPEEADAIFRWFKRHDKGQFSQRDVHRNFARFDRQDIATALRWLVDHNFIAPIVQPAGVNGRPPSPNYIVNPKLESVSETAITDKTSAAVFPAPEPVLPEDLEYAVDYLLGYLSGGRKPFEMIAEHAIKRDVTPAQLRLAAPFQNVEIEHDEGIEYWRLPPGVSVI